MATRYHTGSHFEVSFMRSSRYSIVYGVGLTASIDYTYALRRNPNLPYGNMFVKGIWAFFEEILKVFSVGYGERPILNRPGISASRLYRIISALVISCACS